MDFRFLAEEDVFSFARAVGVGLSPESLRRACGNGVISKLHRGWYATRRPYDEVDRHRLRLTALLQEYGDAVVTSHVSAVVWRGLPVHDGDLGGVHLMWVAPGIEFRSYSRTRIHERLPGDWIPEGARAVDPALAVIQLGMSGVPSMLVAGDAALRRGTATTERFREAAFALSGQRGITAAKAALEMCDPRHESPGESLTAYLLRRLGYSVTPQLVVPRLESPGRNFRADFAISGTRVIVEFDGREKYQDADALFMEKQREDELRRMGYIVVRITWADLKRPDEVRRRIDAAIRLSQRSTA